jgi:TolB protein
MDVFMTHFVRWPVLLLLVAAGCFLGVPTAQAQIRVTKSVGDKVGIQLTGLQADGDQASRVFMRTLQDSLNRSGWMVLRSSGAEVAVSGSVEVRRDQLRVECRVTGVLNRQSYLSQSYRHAAADPARLAYRVADDIVEAVTGRKGMASSRILLIGTTGRAKEMFIMNADGSGLRQLTSDGSISLRPRWGPDADQFTYVSYMRRFPDVYRVTLSTGAREAVAAYPGLNAGGVIAPNGRQMALILSKDGNPELYVKDLPSGRLTRLTRTLQANEASPTWSPDGQRICYVSDQAGRPQLYVIDRSGGRPRRLTSRGSENVAPDWGANNWIAYTSRFGGRYQIALIDPDRGEQRYLAHEDQADYEDPAWAPNGRHLVVTRKQNYRSALYLLDTLGDRPIRLTDQAGDWNMPDWSPK